MEFGKTGRPKIARNKYGYLDQGNKIIRSITNIQLNQTFDVSLLVKKAGDIINGKLTVRKDLNIGTEGNTLYTDKNDNLVIQNYNEGDVIFKLDNEHKVTIDGDLEVLGNIIGLEIACLFHDYFYVDEHGKLHCALPIIFDGSITAKDLINIGNEDIYIKADGKDNLIIRNLNEGDIILRVDDSNSVIVEGELWHKECNCDHSFTPSDTYRAVINTLTATPSTLDANGGTITLNSTATVYKNDEVVSEPYTINYYVRKLPGGSSTKLESNTFTYTANEGTADVTYEITAYPVVRGEEQYNSETITLVQPFIPEVIEETYQEFVILSDAHVGGSTYNGSGKVLKAVNYINGTNALFTVFLGDSADDSPGGSNVSSLITSFFNTCSGLSKPLYAVTGNHDSGLINSFIPGSSGLDNFASCSNNAASYAFDKYGCRFIFVSMDTASVKAYTGSMSTDNRYTQTYKWVEDLLKANTRKRCLVFMHMPVYSVGFTTNLKNEEWVGTTTEKYLTELVPQYPNAVWFSGHMHWSWKSDSYATSTISGNNIHYGRGKDNNSNILNVASVGRPRVAESGTNRYKTYGSEGTYVKINENSIEIYALDFNSGDSSNLGGSITKTLYKTITPGNVENPDNPPIVTPDNPSWTTLSGTAVSSVHFVSTKKDAVGDAAKNYCNVEVAGNYHKSSTSGLALYVYEVKAGDRIRVTLPAFNPYYGYPNVFLGNSNTTYISSATSSDKSANVIPLVLLTSSGTQGIDKDGNKYNAGDTYTFTVPNNAGYTYLCVRTLSGETTVEKYNITISI